MAITSGRMTLTSTPVLIVPQPADKGGYTVIISNLGDESVFLDGSEVTAATGFELVKESTVTVPIAPDEALWGVTAVDETVTICYLVTKR